MMENLLSSSSSMIDTSSVTSQAERVSPVTVAEFDGETVLCRVCGDRASGFHYGVHACEGCKGFFRRSIQQKIQYRPCLKNQQCNIQRVNRNRCQYCRLKKCISVGMSRDAVRFGRVPKKEKARIIEQMQKKNMASQSSELNSLLANDLDVVHAVVTSHRHTCDITQFRAHQMRDLALRNQEYVNCSANMACPLNNEIGMDANANRNNLTDFSESFTPAIKSVVDFAKGIPGFVLLNQDDQVTLLKAGTFEVLLVRLACLFDPHSNTMMFTGGKLYKRQPSTMTTNAGFLLDSMFDFAERFNKMCLIDDEIGLFSAVVLMSPDRPGLRNVEQVEKIQNKLTEALQNIINTNHKEDGTLFAKLLMKTTDLRTLNTLHSEKSVAGQRGHQERKERQNTDDTDMDFQDSLSTRSGRSSPTLSETSNMTMTSGYSGETDGSNVVHGQRLPLEASSHQQVVLRTPYGTFFREEMSGFYGMMADQPRRRCNTLDRDTLTRPRLHTIEEGNRRRYTLDRDYINKMVNRLSDRLETRNSVRGDSVPTSISNSAASSPIQEEGSSVYPAAQGAGAIFTPITVPEGVMAHPTNSVSRTSPLVSSEAIMAAARAGSSPASPKSRSRSGSFTQEDYANMRPRCYSFHLNSEGRAARMSLQRRMMAAERGNEDLEARISPDNNQYLSPEMRRGSVGAAYGLHNRKQSLLVDRPLSYVRGGTDMDKRAAAAASHGLPVVKHLMPDGSIYGMQLTPEMAAQHPGLWHQQAALAMGMTPPMTLPMMQRSREEIAPPLDSRSREWDVAKTLSRDLPREAVQRGLAKTCGKISGSSSCTDLSASENMDAHSLKNAQLNSAKFPAEKTVGEQTASSASVALSPPTLVPQVSLHSGPTGTARDRETPEKSKPGISDHTGDGLAPALRSKTSTPDIYHSSRTNSERSSPVNDEGAMETFGHKKFDRFRKDKVQPDTAPTTPTEDQPSGVKEEKMEASGTKEEEMEAESVDKEWEEDELKIDMSDVKSEGRSPPAEALSPAVSHSCSPSPNSDRPKLSAKEAHPNLLAHLMNSGSNPKPGPAQRLPTTTTTTVTAIAASGIPMGFPWAMPGQFAHIPQQQQQQQQHFKHPLFAPQDAAFPGLMSATSSSSTSNAHPPSSSLPASPSQHTNNSDPAPSTSINSHPASQPNISNGDQKSGNSKEEFHAAAVSHLKDKLLRKYDSKDNLNKLGKDSPSPKSSQTGNTNSNSTDSSAWPANSNSLEAQVATSSTAELNQELATKLTLSSSTSPPAVLTNSCPMTSPSSISASSSSSPPSSTAASMASTSPLGSQSSCPFASQASSTAPHTSHLDHSNPFLPPGITHPSAMSQIPHMLMSQGIHPATLPMYHSMLRQQYPGLRNSIALSQSHGSAALAPLANMQHLAQMFVRSQVAVTSAADADKRQDLGTPLNLASRMDEGHILSGPSSPSHSPQTPA